MLFYIISDCIGINYNLSQQLCVKKTYDTDVNGLNITRYYKSWHKSWKAMIQLSKEHLHIIRTQGDRTYPQECCGIILGHLNENSKTVVEVITTENAWNAETAESLSPNDTEHSKRRRYAISPLELLQAQKAARLSSLAIIGFFHSHPDNPAIPSEFDRMCAWQPYSYIIVSVYNGKACDINSWCLDDSHQFQPEAIEIRE